LDPRQWIAGIEDRPVSELFLPIVNQHFGPSQQGMKTGSEGVNLQVPGAE
jgi:hypothetical protein